MKSFVNMNESDITKIDVKTDKVPFINSPPYKLVSFTKMFDSINSIAGLILM